MNRRRLRRSFAASATLALVASTACASTSTPQGSLRTCTDDADCGAGAYCTEASICRTDCFTDTDCLGPQTVVECNVHGRCIAADASLDDAPPTSSDASDANDDASAADETADTLVGAEGS